MSHTIELYCPVMVDDEPCDAPLTINLHANAAERGGRTSPSYPAYFQVDQSIPTCCPEGHAFTPEQIAALDKEAEDAAESYAWEPDPGLDRWEDMD